MRGRMGEGGLLNNSVTVGPVASRRPSGNHPVNHRPITRPAHLHISGSMTGFLEALGPSLAFVLWVKRTE